MSGRRSTRKIETVTSASRPNMKTTVTAGSSRSAGGRVKHLSSSSKSSTKKRGMRERAAKRERRKRSYKSSSGDSPLLQDVEDDERQTQRLVTLDVFSRLVRDRCVLTERWMVQAPQYDPSTDMEASLVVELDVTPEGELRIKRCVKIWEDRRYQVLIDNVDMTEEFAHVSTTGKLETTHECDKLFYALNSKKVCQGLKTFDPTNPILANLAVKKRGKLWYSQDCTVIVQKVFMGSSCNGCVRMRNQVRRCIQNDFRKRQRRSFKQVRSSFGKAMYSLLNEFAGKGPIPPSQLSRDNMMYDEKLGIYISFELHQRLFIASTIPPQYPLAKSRGKRARRMSNKSRYQQYPSATITSSSQQEQGYQFVTADGQVCYLANYPGGVMEQMTVGDQQFGVPMMVEKYEPEMNEFVLNEQGQYIIQNVNGQQFTLADGQEYEIVGEAPSTSMIEPIELLPADGQQIQIIEVDDATMEQIEVQGSYENMQIAAVDPNDPALSQLFRAFQSQIQGLL